MVSTAHFYAACLRAWIALAQMAVRASVPHLNGGLRGPRLENFDLYYLSLENDNPANRRIRVHFDDPVRPVRIQGLKVLMAFFDDQLLEGRFLGVL